MSVQILSKLTISNIGAKKSVIKARLDELLKPHKLAIATAEAAGDSATVAKLQAQDIKIDIAKIVGESTKAEPGQSAFGEFIRFRGSFAAADPVTGELIATSDTCIIPNFVAAPLAGALKDSPSIEFALMISAVASDNPVGYKFDVRSLMETKVASNISKLLALAGAQPQLTASPAVQVPAPAPVHDKTPEKHKEKASVK